QAYVADTVAPQYRARALAQLFVGTNVGTALGPVIGSWAAKQGQFAPGLLAVVLCAINLAFSWKLLPESRKAGSGQAPSRKPQWHGVWSVLRHPAGGVPRLIIMYAIGMLCMSMMQGALGLYLQATFDVTERTIGYFYAYTGVFAILMRSALIG